MTSENQTSKPLPYANKGDLTTGSIQNHLIRLTLPMVWGLLAVIAVQLADTYFIAMMGDTDVLAGISLTFPITMIISHIVFGINIALSSVVSRLLGGKQRDDARIVVLHGIIMAFTASALIALGTYLALEPLFKLLGADETTYPTVLKYMPIWLIASVILSVPVNGNSAIRASGDTFIPAIVMTASALINFMLDPILIFGWFGFPALGVTGAAIATLIAYVSCMALGLYFLIFKKDLVAIDGLHLDKFKASLKRLIVIAIPAGIANIIGPGTNAVIMAILARYGNEAVAAMGIASRIEAFALLMVIALALGMSPIVGQNWGAKNLERVQKTIKLAIKFNFAWSFFVALVLAIFATLIASSFTNDPQVIEYTQLFFWIVPISYAFGNLVFGWSSAFNAMGKPKRAFIMIVVKSLIITIPFVLVGGWLDDARGVFIGLCLSNILSGVVFHLLSKKHCRAPEPTQNAQI